VGHADRRLPAPTRQSNAGAVYGPRTGAYDSTLAQQIVASPTFSTAIPVDNAPFTMQSFVLYQQAVLVRNPHFFSNFFHAPVLDQITVLTLRSG
jgi:hypothetical protein